MSCKTSLSISMRVSAYLQLNENKFALEDATKCIFYKPDFAPACELNS